jgi:Aspartyl protease
MRWIQPMALLLGGAGLAAAAPDDAVVPFREAWGWAVVVPVGVAGSAVQEFLLDTGTTSTILEPALAAELGVGPSARASLLTPAGGRSVGVGRVALALGGIQLADVEVLIADMPAIRSDQPSVRGILGQSALAGLEYTIDHARRRVVVHGGRSRATPEPVRPTLDVRLGCGAEAARLVLDSGVASPVLFDQGRRSLDVELGGVVRVETNAGDAVWREGRLAALCVAGRRAGPVSVVVRPEGTASRSEDGLLPSRFFARVRMGADGRVLSVHHW